MMSTRHDDRTRRAAPLWAGPAAPTRLVVWLVLLLTLAILGFMYFSMMLPVLAGLPKTTRSALDGS